jgi:hypothetical protein
MICRNDSILIIINWFNLLGSFGIKRSGMDITIRIDNVSLESSYSVSYVIENLESKYKL